jgi:UDP-N-acetylglucosamine 2-epimerase
MRILTVIGARPQFIKAAMVSRSIQAFNTNHPDAPLVERIVHTGQHYVMFDAFLYYAGIAEQRSTILSRLQLVPKQYSVATIHRPANADVKENLLTILRAFSQLRFPVFFPVHPRTKKILDSLLERQLVDYDPGQLLLVEPVGYLDMLMLEKHSKVVLTDSGGV